MYKLLTLILLKLANGITEEFLILSLRRYVGGVMFAHTKSPTSIFSPLKQSSQGDGVSVLQLGLSQFVQTGLISTSQAQSILTYSPIHKQ